MRTSSGKMKSRVLPDCRTTPFTRVSTCTPTQGSSPSATTGGEIIDAGVAEDVGTYVVAVGEPVAASGDHHAQFALVVGALGNFGPKNGSTWRQQGRGR